MFFRPALIGLAVLTLIVVPDVSVAAERLNWKDLEPAWSGPVDPFGPLTEDQQNDLADILWVRDLRAEGELDEETRDLEDTARKRLAAANLDVDELISRSDEFDMAWKQHGHRLVESLDGREIMLPGYVLPLEFEGSKVREFLLVPYVGACIHTPPPPPNQIVYVISEDGLDSPDLYMAVWVTGRISASRSSRNLSLVDGSSDIDVGYQMSSIRIEPYED